MTAPRPHSPELHRPGAGPREAPVQEVRRALLRAWSRLEMGEVGRDLFQGGLLRPRFARALLDAEEGEAPHDAFWAGALAVQLAHEASLQHDDVVDRAHTRRGKPTLAARQGVGGALLEGDRLLARSYRAAHETGSPDFVHHFARAVERTIEGERAQGSEAGSPLPYERARALARAKSGELFGMALATGAILRGSPRAKELLELGRDVGLVYQLVDDFLDFSPASDRGKPALADHARGLWTWPRVHLDPTDPPGALFRERDGALPAHRALDRLEAEALGVLDRLERTAPRAREVKEEVRDWIAFARKAVERELSSPSGPGTARPVEGPNLARPRGPETTVPSFVGSPAEPRAAGADPERVLARHGRSFSFASWFMPRDSRAAAARVYAFCRMVDDTVDGSSDPGESERALEGILERSRRAYERAWREGDEVQDGLERAMAEMRRAEVPFHLVEELVEGVRMDLVPRRFRTYGDLRTYTRRVAGVVGLWLAGLAGVRDPWALEMAEEMGHGMQLTNIARDVGTDLEMGRLYLPLELLERHRLDETDLVRIAGSREPIPPSFAAALEDLLGRADAGYGAAFQALPHLPPGFRSSMAVAARVYQGIHREIRRNGHDTLRRRARTGLLRKGALALSARRQLRRVSRGGYSG